MRILWTLVKVVVGLVIAIPLAIVAVVMAFGILGALLGLALLALKLTCIAFVGYGLFRVARHFFAPAPTAKIQPVRELPSPDPYYEAAMRELDIEMGHPTAR